MKKLFFTVLLISILGFNVFAQSNVSREEYLIYATVLENIYRDAWKENKTKTSFVILDETFNPGYEDESDVVKMKGMSKDFNRKNRTSAKLKRLFPIKYTYEITSKSKVDELLETGRKELDRIKEDIKRNNKPQITWGSTIIWEPFYENYPNSNGYYQFSRIGFSSNKRFALVKVERDASVSGDSIFYILRKTKGNWRIYSSGGGHWVA